jgi:hypothetical protein
MIGSNGSYATNTVAGVGLGKSGTNFCLGIGSGSLNQKLALFKFDGSTATKLVEEAGTSIPNSNTFLQIDIQVINYGVSATVNIYTGGLGLLLSFTGDVTVGGNTSLDSVFLLRSGGTVLEGSEIIVGDTDTRSLSLLTGAPNGNGTTQNWSNPAFTNFNPITINDANSTFTNTTAQDEQAALIDIPSGTFSVVATKVAARAMATTGAVAAHLKLGYNSGGTVGVGSSHTLTTSFTTYEDYFVNDPTTSAPFTQTSFNAVQLDLQSA